LQPSERYRDDAEWNLGEENADGKNRGKPETTEYSLPPDRYELRIMRFMVNYDEHMKCLLASR